MKERTSRARWSRGLRVTAGALAVALALVLAGPAAASDDDGSSWPGPDYEPNRAGHPLHIIAYAAHPFGVAVDYLVLRPCYWIGKHEPFRTIFGFRG